MSRANHIFEITEDDNLKHIIRSGKDRVTEAIGYSAFLQLDKYTKKRETRVLKRNQNVSRYGIKTENDLTFVSDGNIVTIKEYEKVFDKLAEFKRTYGMRNKIVVKAATAAVAIGLGIGVIAKLFSIAGKEITEEDLNKYAKTSYENIIDKDLNNDEDLHIDTEDIKSEHAVYVGDSFKDIRPMVQDYFDNMEKETPELNDEPITLSEDEISNLVQQNNQEINAEDVVNNYNVNRSFTNLPRKIDTQVNDNLVQYDDFINEAAETSGISGTLIRDIFSQESAGGVDKNIGQIEWRFWEKEQPLTVYDYKENKMIKIIFSNNVDKWKDLVDEVYTESNLKDARTNIRASARILEICMQDNKNIPLGIQAYNMGQPNIKKFKDAALNNGEITEEDYNHLTNQQGYEIILNHAANDGKTGRKYVQNVIIFDDNRDRAGLNQYEAHYIDEEGNIVTMQWQVENLIETEDYTKTK